MNDQAQNNTTAIIPPAQASTSSRFWDIAKWVGLSAALGAASAHVREDVTPKRGAIEGAAIAGVYLVGRNIYDRLS